MHGRVVCCIAGSRQVKMRDSYRTVETGLMNAGGAQPLLWVPALPEPHSQEARREGAVQVLPHNSKPSPHTFARLVQHHAMLCCAVKLLVYLTSGCHQNNKHELIDVGVHSCPGR